MFNVKWINKKLEMRIWLIFISFISIKEYIA